MSGEQREGGAARNPDPEVGHDVDLGRYLRLMGRNWWVIAAGFVLGAVVGFGVAVGHGQTYQATATIYLGLPYGFGGDVPLQSAQTNPSTLDQIVHSVGIDERVARACKAPVSSFSNGISTLQVSGTSAKNRQNAYVTLSVLARKPKLDECAANGLARAAVALLAPYANGKIAEYRAQISDDDRAIKQVTAAVKGKAPSSIASVVSVTRLLGLETERASLRTLLAQTIQLEAPRRIGRARATRVTARTSRSSTLVAGLIGMILGIVIVLAWEARAKRDAD